MAEADAAADHVHLLAAPAVAQDEKPQEEAAAAEEEEAVDEELSFFASTAVTATGTSVDTFEIPSPVIVYEAARIDRVSRIGQFFHITLPLLKPVLVPVVPPEAPPREKCVSWTMRYAASSFLVISA